MLIRSTALGISVHNRFLRIIDYVQRAIDGIALPEDQAGDRHHLATAVRRMKKLKINDTPI